MLILFKGFIHAMCVRKKNEMCYDEIVNNECVELAGRGHVHSKQKQHGKRKVINQIDFFAAIALHQHGYKKKQIYGVKTQWTAQHEVTHRLLTLGSTLVSDFG